MSLVWIITQNNKYMKNITIAITILTISISCSDEFLDPAQYPQQWVLVEMSGNIANVPPDTGSDMAWQEHYVLKADRTFVKTRTVDDKIIHQSGIFEYVTLSNGEYLKLVYPSDNELIGNCSSETRELFFLKSDVQMTGTWHACDGPGLKYRRIK